MRLFPLNRPVRWLCGLSCLLAGCAGELPVALTPTISPVSASPSARATAGPVTPTPTISPVSSSPSARATLPPVAPTPTISPVSGSPSARATLPPVEISVPGSDAEEAQAALAATNAARTAAGLAPLSLDAPLSAVAKQRSDDMLERRYFAHVDPDGRDPFYHIDQAGIDFGQAAENIATGPRMDGAGAVDGWLHSEGHRRNILTAGFKRVGFGRAVGSSGKVLWTQLFTD